MLCRRGGRHRRALMILRCAPCLCTSFEGVDAVALCGGACATLGVTASPQAKAGIRSSLLGNNGTATMVGDGGRYIPHDSLKCMMADFAALMIAGGAVHATDTCVEQLPFRSPRAETDAPGRLAEGDRQLAPGYRLQHVPWRQWLLGVLKNFDGVGKKDFIVG